jgi:hypothetical protein
MLAMRRHEDDSRAARCWNVRQQLERIAIRHLDVQEHEIGTVDFDRQGRLHAVRRLA